MARRHLRLTGTHATANAAASVNPEVDVSESVPSVSPAPTSWDVDSLFRSYSGYVATVAFRLLGREHEVDDVVQEVFLSAIKSVDQVREPGAIKGWLATIAVHAASKRLRMRKVRRWLSLDDMGEYEEIASTGATPEQQATLAGIYTMLDSLPVDERVPWVLRRIEGERLDQVAHICGTSLSTAKRKIDAAQAKLDKVLA